MFRIFLKRKIVAETAESKAKNVAKIPQVGGKQSSLLESATSQVAPQSQEQNRRIFRRFQIDYKHLTIMNDADIFVIRDVSSKGFCVEASERAFQRLQMGDIFDARMRYFGEIYDLQARVVWKRDTYVGFEIVMAKTETFLFMQRLLRPIAIGTTLTMIDKKLTQGQDGATMWFRGDESTDLLIWIDEETHGIAAWRLQSGKDCIEWSCMKGFLTGSLNVSAQYPEGSTMLSQLIADDTPQIARKQFAQDVIMAFEHEIKEELLPTFENA